MYNEHFESIPEMDSMRFPAVCTVRLPSVGTGVFNYMGQIIYYFTPKRSNKGAIVSVKTHITAGSKNNNFIFLSHLIMISYFVRNVIYFSGSFKTSQNKK